MHSSNGAGGEKHALVLTENTVLKHSSAQRKVDVNAVAWDVSRLLFGFGLVDDDEGGFED